MFAVEAVSAGRCEWRDDSIANFDRLDRRAHLMNMSSELVTHDKAGSRWLMASEDVQFTISRIVLGKSIKV